MCLAAQIIPATGLPDKFSLRNNQLPARIHVPRIPANAEAWDRLVRYVREHETGIVTLRRSA